MPTLSLCAIMKNEAKYLPLFIQAAKLHCQEICIIDTGSTDDSAHLASSLGARVESFNWCDDFSKARNASLQMATSDWILVLDLDEVILPKDFNTIINTIQNTATLHFHLPQFNYTREVNIVGWNKNTNPPLNYENYTGYTIAYSIRLFRNLKNFQFSGTVHEHLTDAGKILPMQLLETPIHNHGLALAPEKLLEKKKFYHHLALEQTKLTPKDPKASYDAGIASMELGLFDLADLCLKRSLALDSGNYRACMALGSLRQHQKKHDEAIQFFDQVLKSHELNQIRTAKALSLYQLGQKQEALTELQRALQANPDLPQANFWAKKIREELA